MLYKPPSMTNELQRLRNSNQGVRLAKYITCSYLTTGATCRSHAAARRRWEQVSLTREQISRYVLESLTLWIYSPYNILFALALRHLLSRVKVECNIIICQSRFCKLSEIPEWRGWLQKWTDRQEATGYVLPSSRVDIQIFTLQRPYAVFYVEYNHNHRRSRFCKLSEIPGGGGRVIEPNQYQENIQNLKICVKTQGAIQWSQSRAKKYTNKDKIRTCNTLAGLFKTI